MVHTEVETRELGMGVVVHVRALARAAGALHWSLPGQVQRTAGGIVGQLAIPGLGGQEVGLDEAAELERGAGRGARGDAGDLDRLLAGRQRRCGGAFGLHGAHLLHLALRLRDRPLLLLLGGYQQLHLPFKFGHARFERFFPGRFRKGHTRRNQREKQRGSQRAADGFQHVSIHRISLSPGGRRPPPVARSQPACAASKTPGYSPLVEPGAVFDHRLTRGAARDGAYAAHLGSSGCATNTAPPIGYKCKGEGCHD
jgi:hypothetical protein